MSVSVEALRELVLSGGENLEQAIELAAALPDVPAAAALLRWHDECRAFNRAFARWDGLTYDTPREAETALRKARVDLAQALGSRPIQFMWLELKERRR